MARTVEQDKQYRDTYNAKRRGCPDAKARRKAEEQKVRREVIEAYGGACACCGKTYFPHLTLDHVNGGGSEDRRQNKDQRKILRRLRRELPQIDPAFRVLCWCCNATIHFHGECRCQEAVT